MIWPYFQLAPRLEGLPPFEELSCLDLGCGKYESVVAQQVLGIPWKRLISVDGHEPSIKALVNKEAKAKDWSRIHRDVRQTGMLYDVDVIVSFDVLEHLTKEDGRRWLKEVETLAAKRIVLFFPVEPDDFHRSMEESGDADNPLQEHLSHWKPHELESLGYKVEEIFDCHSEVRIVDHGSGVASPERISFGACWAVKNL